MSIKYLMLISMLSCLFSFAMETPPDNKLELAAKPQQRKRSYDRPSVKEPPAKKNRTTIKKMSPQPRKSRAKNVEPKKPGFPTMLIAKILDGRYELESQGKPRFLLDEYDFNRCAFSSLSDTQILFRAKVFRNEFQNFDTPKDAPTNLKKRRSRFVRDIFFHGKTGDLSATVATAFGHLFSAGAVQRKLQSYEDQNFMDRAEQDKLARHAFFCGAHLGNSDARFEAARLLMEQDTTGYQELAHKLLREAAQEEHYLALKLLPTITNTFYNKEIPDGAKKILEDSCLELKKLFFDEHEASLKVKPVLVEEVVPSKDSSSEEKITALPMTLEEKRKILDGTYELHGEEYDLRFLDVVDFSNVEKNADFAEEMLIRAKIINYFMRHFSSWETPGIVRATSAFVRKLMHDRALPQHRGIVATSFGYISSANDDKAMFESKKPGLSHAFLCGAHHGVADAMFEGAMQMLASSKPIEQAYGVLLLISAVNNENMLAIRKWEEVNDDSFQALLKLVDTEENWQGLKDKLKESCDEFFPLLTEVTEPSALSNYLLGLDRSALDSYDGVSPIPIFVDAVEKRKSPTKRLLVAKNKKVVKLGQRVNTDELSEALTISEDSDVYLDDDGKEFLFGIRYGAFRFPEAGYQEAAHDLAMLTRSNCYRKDAAGPHVLDEDDDTFSINHHPANRTRGIELIGSGWKFKNASDATRIRYNPVFSTSFGFSKIDKSFERRQMKLLQIKSLGLSPYLKGMNKSFAQWWPDVFMTHSNGMTKDLRIIPDTVFSSMTINAEMISYAGDVVKNTPRGLHVDNNNTRTATIMFVLKDNIDGGDLFFPEYGENGIIFSLQSGAVICFKGSQEVHGVTPIKRQNQSESATRVTGIAYYKW